MARADRRVRWQIAWRSLRWRIGASIAMLLVAIVGTAAATFGPLYLHGADQSVLQATLRQAYEGNSGLTLLGATSAVTPDHLAQAAASAPRAPDGRPLYASPILTADLPVSSVAKSNGQTYYSDLISRTGSCHHLALAAGACPQRSGQIALSTRSARALGLGVGDHITLVIPAGHRAVALRVTGLFQPGQPQALFWWGTNYFGYGESGSASHPLLDDFFTTLSTIQAIPSASRAPLMDQLPLVSSRLTPDGLGAFTQSLTQFEQRARRSLQVDASSQVRQLLAQAAGEEHTMTIIVAIVLAQLVLLCLIVLYFVAARTSDAREPDIRLAELRGFPRSGIASIALLEPLVVLTVALPLGVLAAWLAEHLVAPHVFEPGVSTVIDPLAIGAALVTFMAGIAATVLGARGLVRRRHETTPRRGGGASGRPIAVAVDAIVVALAVAAFVEVAISGVSAGARVDPLAALAPGLLAFGLGVAGARLLPLGAQVAIVPTRNSPRVGSSLATRRLARLPELSRHIVVLSMSMGLATFAVTGWAVAGHNRATRSAFDVGAHTVLTVQARPGTDFLQAVRRADPTGHHAMAVVIEHASDGQSLAVDASRLAAVASWPAGLSHAGAAAIGRALAGHTAPSVFFSGPALRVSADLLRDVTPAPELQATIFDQDYDTASTLDLGALTPGSHTYQASTGGICASCRLVDLGVTWSGTTNFTQRTVVSLQISSLSAQSSTGAWTDIHAGLSNPRRWQSPSGGVVLGRGPAGLAVSAHVTSDGAPASFGPADVPTALPAVVIGSESSADGANLAVGLDGATITVAPIASVSALPGVGTGATMVDLPLAQKLQSGPMLDTTLQVWLAAGASPAIAQRLEAEGVTIVSRHSAIMEDAALSHTGLSLAYGFFLLAAVAAALLAAGSTVFAVAAAARRRESELASLLAVGIGRSSLRRSLVVEQGSVIGTGLVLGVVAGLAAAAVALPSIPELTSPAAGPPLDYGVPLGPLALTLVAVALVLVVTVGAAARLVVGRATPDKLGGDQS